MRSLSSGNNLRPRLVSSSDNGICLGGLRLVPVPLCEAGMVQFSVTWLIEHRQGFSRALMPIRSPGNDKTERTRLKNPKSNRNEPNPKVPKRPAADTKREINKPPTDLPHAVNHL